MKKWIVVWSAALCLLCPAISFGDVIADSAADFSDAQGPNWLNGLYNQTTDADGTFGVGDFQPFAAPDYVWTGSAWDEANVDGDNVPWTTIDAVGGHPNGDNNGDVHYAVRRWISDASGAATVNYNLAKQNVNCGNGTSAILFHNGAEVSRLAVEGPDGVGLTASEAITLASGDVLDLALSPQGPDGSYADGCDGSAFGMSIETAGAPIGWSTQWQLGNPGAGWPLDGVGGGPDVDFVQEAGVNPPPGDPNSPAVAQQADDDYYFAGTYPDAPAGVGVVASDEIAMERAFAGLDNDLRVHFNLPSNLNPGDKFRFSFEANNLHEDAALNSDPRYGVEVYVNGTLVQPEIVIRPAELNTVFTTAEFTAADVGLVGGPGADNVLWLSGNTNNGANYNAEGGGNWMGMDYHHLEIMPVPEPGTLSMMLCGLFWTIPLVCWENKKKK